MYVYYYLLFIVYKVTNTVRVLIISSFLAYVSHTYIYIMYIFMQLKKTC